jgi:hypothetical protein
MATKTTKTTKTQSARRPPLTALRILKGARKALIPAYKWTQNAYTRRLRHRGKVVQCYCAQGALEAQVRTHAQRWSDAFLAAEGALAKAGPRGGQSIESWNDDPRRTHAQVTKAFDRAILAVQRQEGGR